MSLLIGDICLQADADIEIIATIQLFLRYVIICSMLRKHVLLIKVNQKKFKRLSCFEHTVINI